MKKTNLLALIALATLASCGGQNSSASTEANSTAPSQEASSISSTEIEDANGRKVEIRAGTYSKIVCIGAGALRMYSYVGEASLLAGVEDIDNLEAEGHPAMFDGVARPYFIANSESYKGLPSCGKGGPMAQAAEAEKILNCRPDLVISEYEDVEKADALQKQLGVPVITLKYGGKGVFDAACKKSISLIAEVIGTSAKAETLLSYIDAAEKDLAKRTEGLTSDKQAYICGLGNWGTTNHLMTAKNYEPFNIAHITNIADTLLANNGI
nr:ABC transporter substrate-binding protein [Bacilli bacterium]